MATRWIYRPHGRTIGPELVEDRHQSSGAQIVADQKCRQLCDAVAGEGRLAQRFGVGRTEASVDRERANVSVDAEAPFHRASAVNEGEAAMIRELLDAARGAAAFQVSRCRA